MNVTIQSANSRRIILSTVSLIVFGCFSIGTNDLYSQVTTSQVVNANWQYFDNQLNTAVSDSGSASSNSFGTLNYSAPIVGLTQSNTTLKTAFDAATGSVRSSTTFEIDGPNLGNTNAMAMNLHSFNRVNISDQLSLEPGILGSVRIKVLTHGSMIQDLNFYGNGSDAFVGNVQTFGKYSSVTTADGETKSLADELSDSTGGFFPSEIHLLKDINIPYELLINEDLGNNVFDFDFAWEEEMMFHAEGFDIVGLNAFMGNDFFQTIELFANVYDLDGVLMEGVTVQSAQGITYRNFNAVPEPGSAVVVSMLALGMVTRRRRHLA